MPKRKEIGNIMPIIEKSEKTIGLRLISLTIGEKTNPVYCKILKPGVFNFVTPYANAQNADSDDRQAIDSDLFGKNISIQAIVGENGSGKSSILDMLYRIINNFSYYLMNKLKYTEAARPLAFIKDIYAKVEYEKDSSPCSIECRGDELALCTADNKYRVGADIEEEWRSFEDVTGASAEKVREVMKNFFYTIVTNYSFNAFLSSDYSQDFAIGLHGTSWIDSMFNKNDGYRTPLVLNPYRYNGQLDVQKETNFAVSRTIAILDFYKKKNWQFIDGYTLDKIEYHYDPQSFLGQFRSTLTQEERENLRKIGETQTPAAERDKYEKIIRKKFSDAFQNSESYARTILSLYKIKPDQDNEVYFMACCYLVYKFFSILENYPVYSKYEKYGGIKNCFAIPYSLVYHTLEETKNIFGDIVRDLQKDMSHITYKLRLTLQFLWNYDARRFSECSIDNRYTLDAYRDYLHNSNTFGNLERSMESFPMPLFKPEILLVKVDEKGKEVSPNPIRFSALSSGEKLFTYTLSSIIYHIINIKSVSSSRIHYRRMNIVMDELELCFHPEMQRRFVQKLISTIGHLHLNTHCKFNFLLVTHSPFILSDIPKDRILFLKEGRDVSKNMNINPFATNINEVLVNNFFLGEKGFLGNQAQKWVNSLLDFLQDRKNTWIWTQERAEYFIRNIIGDPFLKECLHVMLNNRKEK